MAFKKTKSIKPQPAPEPIDSGQVMIVTEPKQHPNGHCPKCGTPAPDKGLLLGPPWKIQMQAARLHMSQHHGIQPEEVTDEQALHYALTLHGGFIATCTNTECGTSYLVRMTEWPEIKGIHVQPAPQVVDAKNELTEILPGRK